MMILLLLLVGGDLTASAQRIGPEVTPLGAFELVLPGIPESPNARPRLLLWCRGVRLLGVVVPGETHPRHAEAHGKPGPPPASSTPTALLLRDGRCQSGGGSISFGFLLPMKAWIFESVARTAPEERTTWLLHRFQGSVASGALKGELTQVDVNHPGLSFRESKVEAGASGEDQAAFKDESSWLAAVSRTYTLARSEP